MDKLHYGAAARAVATGSFRLDSNSSEQGNPDRPPASALPRLVLLPGNHDTAGELRVAVLPPGPRGVPVAFPSIGAALAALDALRAQAGAA